MKVFEVTPRQDAQELVKPFVFIVRGFSAVSFDCCIKLLGPERFLMLRRDPIRRLGPEKEMVYPWNLVDYLSCENPRKRT